MATNVECLFYVIAYRDARV